MYMLYMDYLPIDVIFENSLWVIVYGMFKVSSRTCDWTYSLVCNYCQDIFSGVIYKKTKNRVWRIVASEQDWGVRSFGVFTLPLSAFWVKIFQILPVCAS